MYSNIKTASLYGLQADLISVETDLSLGLPVLNIVGLPDLSVKEAKDRIRAAITNIGYAFPAKRIIINLSPANTRKEGTHFDLPIAVGVLAALGVVSNQKTNGFAFLGELSLDGSIHAIRGALPLAMGLRKNGMKQIVLPLDNAEEISILDDILIYPVSHLEQLVKMFSDLSLLIPYQRKKNKIKKCHCNSLDFADVLGQESAKRVFQIAAAASHNLLMIGPPGVGKTMLAQRISTILPPMNREEQLEVTKIHSAAGTLPKENAILLERPFRAPHHTVTPAALIGGGSRPKPGEISLAHGGVLFLDEFPEFHRKILDLLRQPLEEQEVRISRLGGNLIFPAQFMLIAGMNPCPCGYFGSEIHTCTCTVKQIQSYLSRVSGPLLDRIDMQIELFPIKQSILMGENQVSESSESMRGKVLLARKRQEERYKEEVIQYNSQLSPGLIKKYCKLDSCSKKLLAQAFQKLGFSGRSYYKVIRVAQTISDLEECDFIKEMHMAESIRYHCAEKYYG